MAAESGVLRVEAVLFDLDDTLYPVKDWVTATRDVDLSKLLAGRAGAAQRLATAVSCLRLSPYPGVAEALDSLRRRVMIGLVTDGPSAIQRAKLRALGLDSMFDVVIMSDVLGMQRRKPHPLPFRSALAGIGVPPYAAVYVGDKPSEDVVGAQRAGLLAVRVRTGEYRHATDNPPPWMSASDVPAAVAMLAPYLTKSRRREGVTFSLVSPMPTAEQASEPATGV